MGNMILITSKSKPPGDAKLWQNDQKKFQFFFWGGSRPEGVDDL